MPKGVKAKQGFHTNPERINLKGRPAGVKSWSATIRDVAEEIIETKEGKMFAREIVAKSLRNQAIKGNVPAIKEWGDRLDGKAPQGIDITSGGKVVKGVVVLPSQDGGE